MGSYLPATREGGHSHSSRQPAVSMTVRIEDRNKNTIKRNFDQTWSEEEKITREISPTPKLKKKKVNSIATQPDPPVQCPPSQISSSQTSFSLPATVCYEAEGILVVQLEWRGKTYFGTLLSQDKCDRNFTFSEKFPILDRIEENDVKSVAEEVNAIKEENSLIEKSNEEESEELPRNENTADISKDCFDFDNEESLDKETSYKMKHDKKPKKQFTKGFKCDLCEKKYTWYTGLSNHKRFVHNKQKET